MRFSPESPDFHANASNNFHLGKSAGLYFTSDNNNNSPTAIKRIPVISFDHLVGSAISPRFLLSFVAIRFALPGASLDLRPGARLFSDL
jgi:hypothetical protein